MSNIAVVVPTIREESYKEFLQAWEGLFAEHEVSLWTVWDGESPKATLDMYGKDNRFSFKINADIQMFGSKDFHLTSAGCRDLIYNKNDGVRNFGFYLEAQHGHADIIITLDDDTKPIGDPIQDHIDALNKKVPVSWFSHTGTDYMRGFPYNIRDEAEVVLSHGVWEGVKDWDAPTQLVQGNKDVEFFKGPIPKGVYYPMCGMNIAFKRKMLPYMYYAPMGYKVGMDRFADIWLGITSKRIIDEKGWAVVTGYAKVQHDRASNVWKNLQKEAKGLELNETFWSGNESDPYFKLYAEKRKAWEELINEF